MKMHSRIYASVGLLLVAMNLTAQERASCPGGPGAAYGIVSYQCANCAYSRGKGELPTYTFFAEPVVLKTNGATPLLVGDIVEAVNGTPITTNFGAHGFTYPTAGRNVITVRRGRDRHVLTVTVPVPSDECKSETQTVVPGTNFVVAPGTPTERIRQPGSSAPRIIVNGVLLPEGATVREVDRSFSEFDNLPTSGFGFAVACVPSCTAATGREGKTQFTYYKYTNYPPIIAVRPGGPAERAGIRVGDVITKVDGLSVLEDEGGLRLWSVHRKDSIHLTVLRDGKETDYQLKVR